MARKKIEVEDIDPMAVLKAADEIAQLEEQIKARKKAIQKSVNSALRQRRDAIKKILNLKEIGESGYYAERHKKSERRYIIGQIAKAHASGRISIPELDNPTAGESS